jgi:DNA-directed RNA polymerase subunit RPC12/RpoP
VAQKELTVLMTHRTQRLADLRLAASTGNAVDVAEWQDAAEQYVLSVLRRLESEYVCTRCGDAVPENTSCPSCKDTKVLARPKVDEGSRLAVESMIHLTMGIFREYLIDLDADIEGCDADELKDIESQLEATRRLRSRFVKIMTGEGADYEAMHEGPAKP